MQTRDKGSPVPRFRQRESARAKARLLFSSATLATLLGLLAHEGGGFWRKESREQTPSGCYAVSCPPLRVSSPSMNPVNICLSCLTIRLLRSFRFLLAARHVVRSREISHGLDTTRACVRARACETTCVRLAISVLSQRPSQKLPSENRFYLQR